MLCSVHTQHEALTLKLIVFCTQCYLQYDKEMGKNKQITEVVRHTNSGLPLPYTLLEYQTCSGWRRLSFMPYYVTAGHQSPVIFMNL